MTEVNEDCVTGCLEVQHLKVPVLDCKYKPDVIIKNYFYKIME